MKLFGDRSLLQTSYDRVAGLIDTSRILVLTIKQFVPLVREQLPELPYDNIIGEPMRRDTAAAVALAALLCKKRFGNPVMAIMTADHLIEPVDLFQKTLLSAADAAAKEEILYTFGITPTYAATGYGYLETKEEIKDDDGIKHFKLDSFKEKPNLDTAKGYMSSGRYYWNSGMFVWSTDTIIGEYEEHLPSHLEHISNAVAKDGKPQWKEALAKAFEPLKKISVDFAIMERAANIRTVASTFSWSDVGGWLALEEFLEKDEKSNSHRGNIEVFDASSNMVFCEDDSETVALVGVEGLIVVRSGNKTLVLDKSRAEDIKKLVEGLDDELK